MTQTLGERMTAVESNLSGHEETCAVRYEAINGSLSALWRRNGRIEVAAWAIVTALLGWMALQLWTSTQTRIERAERPPVTVIQTSPQQAAPASQVPAASSPAYPPANAGQEYPQ